MLPSTFFARHDENLMRAEGDLQGARNRFFSVRPPNLMRLLAQRYDWMNDYIRPRDIVVEFGAGAGFSREFIKEGNLILTDIVDNPWIDCVADAINPPFQDESIDVIVCSHMIHHLACPLLFFKRIAQLLRPGGLVLIQDVESGWVSRFVSLAMRHEGWSYDVDIYDQAQVANNPNDPWSGNIAIPHLLLSDHARFSSHVPQFCIESDRLSECFLFLLSGGVIARSPTIQLPNLLLDWIQSLDRLLIRLFPDMFAMGRSAVLRKVAAR